MPTLSGAAAQDGIVLSILVKALNEERHIAACLRSALEEAAGWPCEVILVDSLSDDRTVEIAEQFQVGIVQFAARSDRGCGAALQLGYQYARGRYLYVLDGDMTLEPGFLGQAIAYLEAHAQVAGVGGRLRDTALHSAADKRRAMHYATVHGEQAVASLGGGGLYRRSAVDATGYLANRWLPACEEAELGARLRAQGWNLVRLGVPAVAHTGHQESSWSMLKRLWRNGRMRAYGMLLRGAVGQPWFAATVRACWHVLIAPAAYATALLLALLGTLMGLSFASLLVGLLAGGWGAAFLLLYWRKRDAGEALFSIIAWHWYAVAAVSGFARPLRDPLEPIPALVVRPPP